MSIAYENLRESLKEQIGTLLPAHYSKGWLDHPFNPGDLTSALLDAFTCIVHAERMASYHKENAK